MVHIITHPVTLVKKKMVDKVYFLDYDMPMNIKKVNKFRKIIKENQKLLISAGINRYTLKSYMYTSRTPSEDNAKKISAILGIPLAEIPYYRVEHV